MFQQLSDVMVHPEHLMIRRWQDGTPIGKVRTKEMKQWFGSPFVQIHRGDLCWALFKNAREHGVKFETSHKAVHVDFQAPSVTFANGLTKHCDLVVVADGELPRVVCVQRC